MYICEDPKLLAEWDWDENNKISLDPHKITHGSTKKAHWICEQGHKYIARIDHRTIMKSGCPYCAKKLPIVGENDLATTHPHLLDEWDYEKNNKLPKDYLSGSSKKVNWICKDCGNKWQTTIADRALQGSNCPTCALIKRGQAKTKSTIEKNGSLAESFPELIKEWDYEKNTTITPHDVHRSSNINVWWKDSLGHSWKASVRNRVIGGIGCPICAGKKVLHGFNDLSTKFPQIAQEWHPTKNGNLLPSNITAHNDKKVWWLCPMCGESYETSIYSRTSLKTGCPICANRTVVTGKNDLATIFPEIASEWNYSKNGNLLPTDFVFGSNQRVWWQCKHGHEWQATIVDRTTGRGCPTCAKESRPLSRQKTYLMNKGSLSDRYPDIAKQWHTTKNGTLTPNDVTSGSSRTVWWVCEKGHEWQALVYSRVKGNGCPFCNYEHSTSFPEQAIYYYLKQITTAINRYKLNGRELDIFLPSLNVGIEYNGRYYHKNRISQDTDKLLFFKKHSIRVIVIHEGNVSEINNDTIYFKYVNSEYCNLDFVINAITALCSLPSIEVDINRDRSNIYSQYIESEKANSLAAKYPWLIDEWDYEKNGKLTPWNISYGSQKMVHWKCSKCGYKWETAAYSRKNSGCPQCANRIRKHK